MFTFSESGTAWQAEWTLFYWAWWISWSPFVGMFIARISRGRTIREFVAGVLFAPVGASAVWFTVFGGTALRQLLAGDAGSLADAPPENALFVLMNSLPVPGGLATVFAAIAILVVVLFFATSSDSGSLVVDILTNGGDPHPVWQQRLFWAVIEGAVAAVLLYAGSATGEDPLSALQTAALASGLPFCVVLLVMCYSLVKGCGRTRSSRTRATLEPDAVRAHRRSPRSDRAASSGAGVGRGATGHLRLIGERAARGAADDRGRRRRFACRLMQRIEVVGLQRAWSL